MALMAIERNCERCGAKFLTKQSRLDAGYGRYCSRKCHKAIFYGATLSERFFRKVNKDGPLPFNTSLGQCWSWTGSSFEGYGRINHSGRVRNAHIVSMELATGKPIENGLWVLHHCDNPNCVNPDHLFIGTRQDNVDDMERKGRAVHPCGERLNNSSLNAEAIRKIRRLPLTARRLAELFCVSVPTIKKIRRRITWKHVA
jgi:hypothetical protein